MSLRQTSCGFLTIGLTVCTNEWIFSVDEQQKLYYSDLISGGEIPPKKLQALQKVLQSEFCNAIREVCSAC